MLQYICDIPIGEHIYRCYKYGLHYVLGSGATMRIVHCIINEQYMIGRYFSEDTEPVCMKTGVFDSSLNEVVLNIGRIVLNETIYDAYINIFSRVDFPQRRPCRADPVGCPEWLPCYYTSIIVIESHIFNRDFEHLFDARGNIIEKIDGLICLYNFKSSQIYDKNFNLLHHNVPGRVTVVDNQYVYCSNGKKISRYSEPCAICGQSERDSQATLIADRPYCRVCLEHAVAMYSGPRG